MEFLNRRIGMDARLESGLLFKPPREVILIQKAKLFADIFDAGLFPQKADGLAKERGVTIFAQGLAGGLLENPVQVVRLVSHRFRQRGNFRERAFALAKQPFELPDKRGEFPAL